MNFLARIILEIIVNQAEKTENMLFSEKVSKKARCIVATLIYGAAIGVFVYLATADVPVKLIKISIAVIVVFAVCYGFTIFKICRGNKKEDWMAKAEHTEYSNYTENSENTENIDDFYK